MKSPLLVVLVRLGKPSESEPYANMLRETFLGPDTMGSAGVGAKELLQTTELREFVFDDKTPDSGPWPLPLKVLGSTRRLLIIVLDAREDQQLTAGSLSQFENELTKELERLRGSRKAVLEVFSSIPAACTALDCGAGGSYGSGSRILRSAICVFLFLRCMRFTNLFAFLLQLPVRLLENGSACSSVMRSGMEYPSRRLHEAG